MIPRRNGKALGQNPNSLGTDPVISINLYLAPERRSSSCLVIIKMLLKPLCPLAKVTLPKVPFLLFTNHHDVFHNIFKTKVDMNVLLGNIALLWIKIPGYLYPSYQEIQRKGRLCLQSVTTAFASWKLRCMSPFLTCVNCLLLFSWISFNLPNRFPFFGATSLT